MRARTAHLARHYYATLDPLWSAFSVSVCLCVGMPCCLVAASRRSSLPPVDSAAPDVPRGAACVWLGDSLRPSGAQRREMASSVSVGYMRPSSPHVRRQREQAREHAQTLQEGPTHTAARSGAATSPLDLVTDAAVAFAALGCSSLGALLSQSSPPDGDGDGQAQERPGVP